MVSGWILGMACIVSSMCSVIIFYDPNYEYDVLEASIYAALHRSVWCLGVGWVMLACITNNAGKSLMLHVMTRVLLLKFPTYRKITAFTRGNLICNAPGITDMKTIVHEISETFLLQVRFRSFCAGNLSSPSAGSPTALT